MADRPSTFPGIWSRPPQDGVGHSAGELQKRAGYDHAPAQGFGCAAIAPIAFAASGGLWWGLYEGGRALIGAIA